MAGANEFKLFCSNAPGTADSLDPASYAALGTILANGFQSGEASSRQANTVWRQATTAAAVIGEIIARTGDNARDNRNVVGLADQLIAALAALLPPAHYGDIKLAAYTDAGASGWLLCNGVQHGRTSYPALFAAIGTTFNQPGDSATSFRTPDMRGMFPRGYDAGRGVDPSRVFGTYQADAMPSHVHTVNLQPLNSADAGGAGKLATGNSGAEGVIPPFNTAATGVGSETLVKNIALSFFIYAGQPAITGSF